MKVEERLPNKNPCCADGSTGGFSGRGGPLKERLARYRIATTLVQAVELQLGLGLLQLLLDELGNVSGGSEA
jgi:hypothetical protein